MLTLQNVEVKYRGVILALKGVSLEVPEGGIVSILGANGAGKSTLLKCVSGMIHAQEGDITDGTVYFDGHRLNELSAEHIAKLGIIHVMEGRRILQHLTTEQNLLVGSHMRGDRAAVRRDLDFVYSLFPKLKDLRGQSAGYLSGGEQQMMVIGRAIMARPKIVLLDEPSLGLGPLIVREIFDVFKRLNVEEKLTMLLVEQNVKIALSIAQYGYILETGRVVLKGRSSELLTNEDVKEFYLGLDLSGERRDYRNVKHYKRRKRWLG
jgi:branched-chain amino acid transport system ATP-binding protein